MTRQLVFETKYSGNSGTVAARPMLRHWEPEKGHYWAHSPRRVSWNYALDIDDNHKNAILLSCRVALQKDPVAIEWGGESVNGRLWIVTVTE